MNYDGNGNCPRGGQCGDKQCAVGYCRLESENGHGFRATGFARFWKPVTAWLSVAIGGLTLCPQS
jgi:hypothetical protein